MIVINAAFFCWRLPLSLTTCLSLACSCLICVRSYSAFSYFGLAGGFYVGALSKSELNFRQVVFWFFLDSEQLAQFILLYFLFVLEIQVSHLEFLINRITEGVVLLLLFWVLLLVGNNILDYLVFSLGFLILTSV